jgi:hypothetical protein
VLLPSKTPVKTNASNAIPIMKIKKIERSLILPKIAMVIYFELHAKIQLKR